MKAGIFLFFICILYAPPSFCQSYFYFENKVPINTDSSLTYFNFLMLQPDGQNVARFRTLNHPMFEEHFKDSTVVGNENIKYLIPKDDTIYDGTDNSLYLKFRYLFKRKTENGNSFFVPDKVEFLSKDGQWKEAAMATMQEKPYGDLVNQKDFVSVFFTEDDEFYKYLYGERLRANSLIARKERFFLIVVANTNDPKIGITSKRDLESITELFSTLSSNLGMRIITTTISGNDFSKGNVEAALKNLKNQKPSKEDIVIFYYSGHGFRYSNDKSVYPRMSLRANGSLPLSKNNLEVESVYNQIVKLGARLNIVINDCCNNDIGAINPEGGTILRTRFSGFNTTAQSLNLENCNALFFAKEKTSIIVSSAEKKQLASGNPDLGGFFTYYFKTILEQGLYSFYLSNSWLRLLLTAKEKARYQALTALCGTGRCIQLAEIKVTPPK